MTVFAVRVPMALRVTSLAGVLVIGGCATQEHHSEIEQPVTLQSGVSASPSVETSIERIPHTEVEFELVWIGEGEFWIGKAEVTWDEYLVYCAFDQERPIGRDGVSRPSKPLEVAPPDRHWGYGKQPAVGMSWNGAKRYCAWLSGVTGRQYRLPTEAEWRLACGDPVGNLDQQAWFASNSDGQAHAVALKEPNAHGVHDMLGNLWEYCANPYDAAQPKRAALRGGSWNDGPELVTPDARLRFDNDWTLDDPSFPPGVWWVPDGHHLGLRVLCEDRAP